MTTVGDVIQEKLSSLSLLDSQEDSVSKQSNISQNDNLEGVGSETRTENTSADDCFDASQYAFFGTNIDTEVELGGLGDRDDEGSEGDIEDEGPLEDEEGIAAALAAHAQGKSKITDAAWSFGSHGDDLKLTGSTSVLPAIGTDQTWLPPSLAQPSSTSSLNVSLDTLNQWWPSEQQKRQQQQSQEQEQQPLTSHALPGHALDPELSRMHLHGPPRSSTPPTPPLSHSPPQQQWWEQQQQQPLQYRRDSADQINNNWPQQQQQQRMVNSQRMSPPHVLSLEEIEAGLTMQVARTETASSTRASTYGSTEQGTAALSRTNALQAPFGSSFGGSSSLHSQQQQQQHQQIMPPYLPHSGLNSSSSSQWPPTSAAMLAAQAQIQAQSRGGYIPPQLLQAYQRTPTPPLSPPLRPYLSNHQPEHMAGFEHLDGRFDAHQLRFRQHANQRQQQVYQQQRSGGSVLRSKYMTAEEIDAIVRIQWAATHASEPYVDDYYHQAVRAKANEGTPHGRRHFAPNSIRDLPSHARGPPERQLYLPVDGLGRLPLSSLRRPRPLLEMDSADGSGVQRPLDQEPMLAARIAIEDGMCLLLDVDDIDRVLLVAHSHPPDTVAQLRRRRQLLLESLASSLQLSDPLAPGSGMAHYHDAIGRLNGAAAMGAGGARDDLVFLRLVSLPKGRKLLTRFLRLLVPGSELQRIVAMAVFRHLRFLFGPFQSDPTAGGSGLAPAAVAATSGLQLSGATACLAAVAVAPEQPPLGSLGSSTGDGATMILRALLERATALRSDPGVSPQLQGAWQAAFDVFFDRLSKALCFEAILSALPLPATAAAAVSKEMPLELLRAALPHTSQAQREQVGALLQGLLRAA